MLRRRNKYVGFVDDCEGINFIGNKFVFYLVVMRG